MDTDQWRFEVGALLRETSALLAKSSWRVIIAWVALTAIGTLIDSRAQQSSNILFSFVGLVFQWWLTTFLLNESDKGAVGGRGSGSIIGVSFLSGLGILVGLLLLIIPGIILFVRWSIAIPIVLSKGDGVIAALRESWYRTEGHFWPILGLLLVVYVPLFAFAFAVGVLIPSAGLASSILVNAGLSVTLIIGWHAAVALFFASEPPTRSLEEVFA
jgi:hypothetical protein